MLISGTLRSLPILILLNLHPLLLGQLPLLLPPLAPLLLDRLDLSRVLVDDLLVVRRVTVCGRVTLLLAHVD